MSTSYNKKKKNADKSKKSTIPSNSCNAENQVNGRAVADKSQFAKEKFREIQIEHLQNAKKYVQNYESSSEEEGLESESVLESVFKSYGGEKNELSKTQECLENIFLSGASTCLICIGNVKRTDYVSFLWIIFYV